MGAQVVKRKLVAILAADVQGYSRLMGADEVAALRTLTAYRPVTDSLITHYHGRVVNTAGDSILAEFASVVDAVQCAVDIQRELKIKNDAVPEPRRMELRIGINLGDVMVEGEQIYGDGVNIAARLESLADGGGICLAGNVYEQIRHKLPLPCEDLGEQRVKNIAEPVRVYRVHWDESSSHQVARHKSKADSHKPRRVGVAHRSKMLAAVVSLILLAGTVVTVWNVSLPAPNPQPLAPGAQAATAALPLPDKPSIIVLPFVNMSEDPQQEYFSDGITEDLTSALSKISSLFVLARNSALGGAYCQLGRYENAIATNKEAIARNPNLISAHGCLMACFSMAGRDEEAQAQMREILRISPSFSLEAFGEAGLWKNPADGKAMLDALRRVGLK